MTDHEDLDDLVDDVSSDAETDAIEAKADAGDTRHGAYTTHLAAVERERWVNLTARHAEHIRRLARQVIMLGGKPVIEPPPAEVVIGSASDAAKISHLQTELRVASSQIDEHARQKAALRMQINQLVAQVEQLRKDR